MALGLCTTTNVERVQSLEQLKQKMNQEQLRKILNSDFLKNKFPDVEYDLLLENAQEGDDPIFERLERSANNLLLELAVWTSKTWVPGTTITVKFLNNDRDMEPAIQDAATEWARHAYINFQFVAGDAATADIRIQTATDGDSHSLLGTDCLQVRDQRMHTMKIAPFRPCNFDDVYATALHEFGHALGFVHEHQSPAAQMFWDEAKIIRAYSTIPGWNEAKIRHNIIRTFPQQDISNSTYDSDSIMHYPFPREFTLNNRAFRHNTTLSVKDIAFAKVCYPGR